MVQERNRLPVEIDERVAGIRAADHQQASADRAGPRHAGQILDHLERVALRAGNALDFRRGDGGAAQLLAPALTLDGRLERVGEEGLQEQGDVGALPWLDADPGREPLVPWRGDDQLGRSWRDAAQLEATLRVGHCRKIRFAERYLDPGEPPARSALAHRARHVDQLFRRNRRRGRRCEVERELDADREGFAAAASGLEAQAAGRGERGLVEARLRRRQHSRGRHFSLRVHVQLQHDARAAGLARRVLRFHGRPGGARRGNRHCRRGWLLLGLWIGHRLGEGASGEDHEQR